MQTRGPDVRVLDVADDKLMRRWYDLTEAADLHERPWAPQWSFEEMTVQFRESDGSTRRVVTGAFEGNEMVGAGTLVLPLLDNTDKAYGGVYVEPWHRGRGIGSALVECFVALLRAERRSALLVESALPVSDREHHPYARFARKHGFSMANVEVRRVLDLPLDKGLAEAMGAEAAPHHESYEIVTFEDEIPEDLLPSYVDLLNLLALDAPTGEIDFEAEAITPEVYLRNAEMRRAAGRHRLTTLAVTPDGEAVAYTDFVVPREDRPKVYQFGTLVRRDHRGHRLGTAVKLQNLRALQERYPDRTEIHTTNSEENASMVAINERLGFRVVEICPEFQLKL